MWPPFINNCRIVEPEGTCPICLADVPDLQTAGQWLLSGLLGPREQQYWSKTKPESPRSRQWLAGRLAGKCALDLYFKREHALALTPDQMEILADNQGAPLAAGACRLKPVAIPDLSIAHTIDLAAAVAAPRTGRLHPGVDLERIDRRLSQGFIKEVYSQNELDRLAALITAEHETWLIRLWCAREAAAKSLGLGLVTRTHHFSVPDLDPHTGRVLVRLSDQLAAEIAYDPPPVIPVRTMAHESWILAVTDLVG